MAIHQQSEGNLLAAITTQGFEFSREIAHEQGMDLGVVVLGDKTANPPAVMILDMPAGHVLVRHAHDTHRMEIVLRGSIWTPDGRELHPGDVSLSAPGEFYGPLTAGSDGCMTVEVFAGLDGLVPYAAGDSSSGEVAVLASVQQRSREHLGG